MAGNSRVIRDRRRSVDHRAVNRRQKGPWSGGGRSRHEINRVDRGHEREEANQAGGRDPLQDATTDRIGSTNDTHTRKKSRDALSPGS